MQLYLLIINTEKALNGISLLSIDAAKIHNYLKSQAFGQKIFLPANERELPMPQQKKFQQWVQFKKKMYFCPVINVATIHLIT